MEQGDVTANDIRTLFTIYFSLSVLLQLSGKSISYFTCCISMELLSSGKMKILTYSSVPLILSLTFLARKWFSSLYGGAARVSGGSVGQ